MPKRYIIRQTSPSNGEVQYLGIAGEVQFVDVDLNKAHQYTELGQALAVARIKQERPDNVRVFDVLEIETSINILKSFSVSKPEEPKEPATVLEGFHAYIISESLRYDICEGPDRWILKGSATGGKPHVFPTKKVAQSAADAIAVRMGIAYQQNYSEGLFRKAEALTHSLLVEPVYKTQE